MARLALLAALALAAPPAAAPSSTLAAAAAALAAQVGPPPDGRRTMALAVEVQAPALAAPLEAALSAALARAGYGVTPIPRGPDPEAAARTGGHDWLLRVQGGLVPGRRELALVGELVPTWTSFFLQRRPDARAAPPRVVQWRAEADLEALLLARPERPGGPGRVAIRTLARVPGRVLALAVGEVEPTVTAIVAVTDADVTLLSTRGERIATRPLDPAGRRPVRAPAATAAIGDFGAGRIAVAVAGAPQAEVLAARGDRLEAVAALAAAPLCAGDAGRLFGAFVPGEGALQDLLTPGVDPEARPRSSRALVAVAAAPRGGQIAFAALGSDARLAVLSPDLSAAAPALDGVGAGFALADLDGDGLAEVVASSTTATGPDRVRVVAPLAPAPLVWESAPVAGAILSGAGGDLTGDGVDDALLGAIVPGEGGGVATELLLVTSDPREVR